MALRSAYLSLAVIFAVAMMACDEHVPPGPDPGDHTPPGITDAVAWDAKHIILWFDEPVVRWSADTPAHYRVASVDEAEPLTVIAASLHADYRHVTLTTSPMLNTRYVVTVFGVTDVARNTIERFAERGFEGTTILDTTPPEVVYRVPEDGATGVSTGTVVTVAFSEEVEPTSVFHGLRLKGGTARLVSIRYDDLLHFNCDLDSLQSETSYTVTLSGIQDLTGNLMPTTEWPFDTGTQDDSDEPVVVSTRPLNREVNVANDTDLSLTFSEPMDPYSLILRPSVKRTSVQWTNGGRRVTFETTFQGGKQYTVQIRPGEMSDPSGNVSTKLFTLTFSTGPTLETGSFSGTIIGDPNSPPATDPSGGLVLAGSGTAIDLYTSVVAVVDANDQYEIPRLHEGVYFPMYVKDTDGNGIYQPTFGDAVGIFGVSDWPSNAVPGSVLVADGRVSGINFQVFDPVAAFGLLSYEGIIEGPPIRVGLFATAGFDPMVSTPVVAITATSNLGWDYIINNLSTAFPEGSYYVAAFLDANENDLFDPATEPLGVYGGANPIAVDLTHGNDAPAVNITLNDPSSTAASAHAIRWPEARPSPLLQRVVDALAASAE